MCNPTMLINKIRIIAYHIALLLDCLLYWLNLADTDKAKSVQL